MSQKNNQSKNQDQRETQRHLNQKKNSQHQQHKQVKKNNRQIASRWDVSDDENDLFDGTPSYGHFLNELDYDDSDGDTEDSAVNEKRVEKSSPKGSDEGKTLKKSNRRKKSRRKGAFSATAPSNNTEKKPANDSDGEDYFFDDDADDDDLTLPSYGRSHKLTLPESSPNSLSSPKQLIPESVKKEIPNGRKSEETPKKQTEQKNPSQEKRPIEKRSEKKPEFPKSKQPEHSVIPDRKEDFSRPQNSKKTLPKKAVSPESTKDSANHHEKTESRPKIEPQSREKTREKEPPVAVQKSLPFHVREEKTAKKKIATEKVPQTPPKISEKPVSDAVEGKKETSQKSRKTVEKQTGTFRFGNLNLSEVTLNALKSAGYNEPTPVQSGVIPFVLKGLDVMGQAHTGTGKTAAFLIPILEGVDDCDEGNEPVALILVPTRELAVQIRDEGEKLAQGRSVRFVACYGGKPIATQIKKIQQGVDIVVGTPGRILDLANRKVLSFNSLIWVVLDEADRMLDIGFRPDIEKILRHTPSDRQTLLLSATLPPPVVKLAERYMRKPEIVDFSESQVTVETIEQYYITVDSDRKLAALVQLLNQEKPNQAIIFCRTKRGVDRLKRQLEGQYKSLATLHGDIQQSVRDRVMGQFRTGKLQYLVATDVIGRGIDISGISHIINYDIPKFCDDYVHRVGRTGRMGREGVAYTLVTAEEGPELTRIEMRINRLLKRVELKGFQAVTLVRETEAVEAKPVFGKSARRIRRAL
ncbi:MAG: DEAD/DEAH box helicase [Planctomycetaceae bacterium]|nr:DEAD/DEAH box helicase [Planctomycetaceae bacterium]